MKMLITPNEYFNNHDIECQLSEEQVHNAIELLYRINLLRQEMGIPFKINSGFRPRAHNVAIGGAPNSLHIQCAAIDIADPNGVLFNMVTANNNELLVKYDLYAEDRKRTPQWLHLQLFAPASKRRVFMP